MRILSGVILAVCVLLAGCADKRPVLYPNARLKQVGADVAQRDVDECLRLAREGGADDDRGAEVAKSTAGGAAVGGRGRRRDRRRSWAAWAAGPRPARPAGRPAAWCTGRSPIIQPGPGVQGLGRPLPARERLRADRLEVSEKRFWCLVFCVWCLEKTLGKRLAWECAPTTRN